MYVDERVVEKSAFYSKFVDFRLKNSEKIEDRQTDGRTGLMNSTEHIFSEICPKKFN
jgi:hypothetical protein